MEAADLKFVNGKFTEGELEQAIIELFQRQDANGVRWSYANGELQTLVSELKRIPSTPLYDGCRRAFWLINELSLIHI